MRRIYHYLFVAKDPVLMAMPHRRLIGVGLMVVGLGHIVLAFGIIR
jgi:hypothetical protein